MILKNLYLPILVAFIFPGLISVSAEDTNRIIRGFEIPELDDRMKLKSKLSGETAQYLSDDLVKITDLRFELYSDGKVETVITSPLCVYDRKSEKGNSKSSIRMVRENGKMILTGRGFSLNKKKGRFYIDKDVRMELRNINRESMTGGEQ